MKGWVGVDLDGTLAEYHGWEGVEHIGDPIPRMMDRVKGWIAEGKAVKIFTARVSASDENERALARHHIWKWCEKHGLPLLEITNVKDRNMIALWDDRCVQVHRNYGDPEWAYHVNVTAGNAIGNLTRNGPMAHSDAEKIELAKWSAQRTEQWALGPFDIHGYSLAVT